MNLVTNNLGIFHIAVGSDERASGGYLGFARVSFHVNGALTTRPVADVRTWPTPEVAKDSATRRARRIIVAIDDHAAVRGTPDLDAALDLGVLLARLS